MSEGAIAGSDVEAPALTAGELRRDMAKALSARWGGGDENRVAGLDARLLLSHALGVDSLAAVENQPVPAEIAERAWSMVRRRATGEPVARIVGEKEFWGLPFRLSPATLVPRPDTETLVSAALDLVDAAGRRSEPLRLLDIGTGTGCILLALLSELPAATGLGVDCSAEAVATATENAVRLRLQSRAQFVAGNWADGIGGRFDAILANPPYVEDGALPDLPVEVIGHDPRVALSGGRDGLEGHRAIIPALARLLAPSGFAVMEFGPRQAGPIAALAKSYGFAVEVRRDLAGRERAAVLSLSNEASRGTDEKALGNLTRSD